MSVPVLAIVLISAVGGAAAGYGLRAWTHPTTVSEKDAAEQGQQFVTSGVEADRAIYDSERASDAASERVRTIIREVQVDKECPPGRGPVSAPVGDSMRAEFSSEK